MYLAMTIHTGIADVVRADGHRARASRVERAESAALEASRVRANRRTAGMRTIVAFLTHEWRTGLQQRRDVGTVRRMADGAVFNDRLVCKQVRSAFVSVAEEASLVGRILLQQFGAR